MTPAVRAVAAVSGLLLIVVLSLSWFRVVPQDAPPAGGSGILNLLNTYSSARVSGWAGLSPFAIAFLLVAAVATVAGRGVPAVGVATIALVWLVADLVTREDDLAVRWPAYAGVMLAGDLLLCATRAWRRAGAKP